MTPETTLPAAQALARALKVAQWRNHRALDSALRDVGSTLVQWDAMRAVASSPGASGHELAALTFMSDQAFATLAERMVARGLVDRTPGKGRRIEHHLTAAGRSLLDACSTVVDAVLHDRFARLDESERGALLRLLGSLGED